MVIPNMQLMWLHLHPQMTRQLILQQLAQNAGDNKVRKQHRIDTVSQLNTCHMLDALMKPNCASSSKDPFQHIYRKELK